MGNKWYIATLIMQSEVGASQSTPWLCDRQIWVVRAPDESSAYEKAVMCGQSAQHSYKNSVGEEVRWSFVGVEDLDELLDRTIKDGTEIKSFLFEHNNPQSLIPDKEDMTISWVHRNLNRTAADILASQNQKCGD